VTRILLFTGDGGVGTTTTAAATAVRCVDEVVGLSDLKRHATSGEWDVVVVDCAPTAETIGLLSLPEALGRFGAELYGELDPAGRPHEGQPLRVHRRGGRSALSLDLPLADGEDLDLGRRGDELLVRVGSYRRTVLLPDSLRARAVVDASLRDGTLEVVFEGSRDGR
jgi:anion-transporting  ArsA/GET3 family ATPase